MTETLKAYKVRYGTLSTTYTKLIDWGPICCGKFIFTIICTYVHL